MVRLPAFRRLFRRPAPIANLVVLGTSNCIGPHSFVTRIRRWLQTADRNLSIGASASSVGLYLADLIPPTDRGVALLDYTINDNDAGSNLWGEAIAGKAIGANLRTLANRLRSMNYLPMLLMLPSDLSERRDFLGERLHHAFCLRENVHFINLRKIFHAALDAGADKQALMKDDWHMSPGAANLFARFLTEVIDQLATTRLSTRSRVSSVLSTRTVLATELFRGDALIPRKSSLHSASFGKLGSGDVVRIPVGSNERLAGLVVNCGAEGGTLAIRGKGGEAVKSMTFQWSGHRPEVFFSLLVDIAQPIVGGDDGVAIEIVSDDRAPTEPTIHGRPARPGRIAGIEIEGVLIAGRDETEFRFSSPEYQGLPLDLGELPQAGQLFDGLVGLASGNR